MTPRLVESAAEPRGVCFPCVNGAGVAVTMLSQAPRTLLFADCVGVFQGGGCRAAAFAGAYTAACERGVHFSEVAGTSAGAMVAALIACGAEPTWVEDKLLAL